MKIVSKSAPAVMQPPNANAGQPSSRDRAIAKYNEGLQPTQPQTSQAKNPTQVSPEDSKPTESQAKVTQTTTNEGQSVQSTSEEPKVVKTETSQPDKLSPQYNMLAKKERALRAEVQKLKAREDALKSKEQEYQSKYIPKDKFSADPVGALIDLGYTDEQITGMLLSRGNPEQSAQTAAFQKIEAQVQALKDAQEADRKSAVEQQTQAYQQALNQIRSEAKKLVQVDPYFEVIRDSGSVKDVVDLIERTYNEDGILLSVEDAAREVEDYLTEKAEKRARLGKIQSRLQPKKVVSPEPKQEAGNKEPQQQQMKTLTNSMSTSRQLSARERAILAFKGQLDK